MSDLLSERFALITDPTDDSDWLEVRRRARTRSRLVAAAVVAATFALLAAAALAASQHWRFFAEGTTVTVNPHTGSVAHRADVRAVTTVQYHGTPWRLTV